MHYLVLILERETNMKIAISVERATQLASLHHRTEAYQMGP
jgi:hypothetical protein